VKAIQSLIGVWLLLVLPNGLRAQLAENKVLTLEAAEKGPVNYYVVKVRSAD
jgi:hypothetical protein